MEKNQRIISGRASTIRDDQDLDHIATALFSGEMLSGNSSVIVEYESRLADYFGTSYAVALSSGTAAIHAALSALEVSAGDEIIVPVTAPIMTVMPIVALGATPVFVDCQSDSFGINLTHLEKIITKNTKGVISVPMWGYPTNIYELVEYARASGLFVLEDVAQAIGTKNRGKFEGTIGDIGCFSTHELKLISTGEGGGVLTANANLAARVIEFSRFGLWRRSEFPERRGQLGYSTGLNLKLNALSAALGIEQVSKLSRRLRGRHEKAGLWANYLKNVIPFPCGNELTHPNYYSYLVRLPSHLKGKAKEVAGMLQEEGIITDTVYYDYKPLCQYPVFRTYCPDLEKEEIAQIFPNADRLISSMVVLPTHERIEVEDIQYVANCLNTLTACAR